MIVEKQLCELNASFLSNYMGAKRKQNDVSGEQVSKFAHRLFCIATTLVKKCTPLLRLHSVGQA